MPRFLDRLLRRRRPVDDHAALTCRELVDLVTDYLEGAMPASERDRFAAHLAACDACTEYVEQMRTTLELLGRIEPESVSADAEEALLAAFRDWKAS